MRYPIVIHKEKNSNYGVIVPDLPGCFSTGATLDEAIENAREAIECHLEGLLLDGEPIPEPGTVEAHQDNPKYAGGYLVGGGRRSRASERQGETGQHHTA